MCRATNPLTPTRSLPGALRIYGGGHGAGDTQELPAPAFTYNGSATGHLRSKELLPNHDIESRAKPRVMPNFMLPGALKLNGGGHGITDTHSVHAPANTYSAAKKRLTPIGALPRTTFQRGHLLFDTHEAYAPLSIITDGQDPHDTHPSVAVHLIPTAQQKELKWN